MTRFKRTWHRAVLGRISHSTFKKLLYPAFSNSSQVGGVIFDLGEAMISIARALPTQAAVDIEQCSPVFCFRAEMDGPHWMSRLPDELLALVLSHLPARDLLLARAVCRRWRDLVADRRVWWRCSLRVVSMADVPLAMAVLGVAPYLHHLLLDEGKGHSASVPKDDVEKILEAAASVPIVNLELHVIFWPAAKRVIAAQKDQLQSLNLSVRDWIYVDDIMETVSKLKLVQLAVILNEREDMFSLGDMAPLAPAPPGGSVEKSLKRLHVACVFLPDAVVAALVRASARSLEEVRVVYMVHPLSLTMAALAECAGQLRHLDFCVQAGITDILLMCERLASLCLRLVRVEEHLLQYFKSAIGLKSLTLRGADGLATLKCLRSLESSGRSSLVHLRLSNNSSYDLPPMIGDEPLYGAGFTHLRTLRLGDSSPQEFLLRWHSPPALQILDLEGSQCRRRENAKCLLECVRVAVNRAQSSQLHVIRFKFMLCDSEAAHARLKCCHWHNKSPGSNDRKLTSPLCGVFYHVPSEQCKICGDKNYNVAEWLWSRDDNFNLGFLLSTSY